ncbi:hypothetical protein [Rickettsiella massiliensis]|uniref:hypothetical protein n=1 Tax=Rickettsiella massiliensis TaxID=676517 RepID=UPI00029A1FBD|nr:hypothetical protein [Rickettsiella massiliensis]
MIQQKPELILTNHPEEVSSILKVLNGLLGAFDEARKESHWTSSVCVVDEHDRPYEEENVKKAINVILSFIDYKNNKCDPSLDNNELENKINSLKECLKKILNDKKIVLIIIVLQSTFGP